MNIIIMNDVISNICFIELIVILLMVFAIKKFVSFFNKRK